MSQASATDLTNWTAPIALSLYVILGIVLALSRPPHSDEGHFVSAGAEFARHNRLAMPMWTSWLPTLDEHLYALMPLYFVMLGMWFKVFGVGLEAMRLFSVVGGVVYLLCLYQFLRRVSPDKLVAVLGVVLVGLHYDFINLSTTRYDIWLASFNLAALASYVCFRENHPRLAVLISNCFLAAAALTHPYAIFGLAGLLVFAVFLDFRRPRPATLLIAALPYVVAFGLWGLYILQDADDFVFQFSRNAEGRLADWHQPITALKHEVWMRYVVELSGWRADAPEVMRVKMLVLPLYALGVVGCCSVPSLRRNRHCMALLTYIGVAFLMLALLEAHRWYVYLIHIIPLYLMAVSLWFAALLRRGRGWRCVVCGTVGALAVFTAVTVVHRARLNVHHRLYYATVAELRDTVQESDLVMCSAELGVGLRLGQHVLADPRLGFETGTRPDFVVVDDVWAARFEMWRTCSPDVYEHVIRTLDGFDLTYQKSVGSKFYRIYERRDPRDSAGLAGT